MRVKQALILIALCSSTFFANAQTTEGRDFWLGFMKNLVTPDNLLVVITSDVTTTGTIEMPLLGWSQTFSVSPGNSTRILMPASAETIADDQIKNNAIHIQSVDCISVFALNRADYSADATVILPTEALDVNYLLTTYVEFRSSQNFSSEFLVVATEDNTIVEITLSRAQNGHAAGVPYQITLNAGQVYQIMATRLDLSGTKVVGLNNKKFALFGGADCSNIGNCIACDHLFEQMFPLSAWGNEFVVVPLKTRQRDLIKVMASTNNTQITINGGAPITLNTGQVHSYYSGTPSYITSTSPITVAQFSLSSQCDGTPSDPFYIMLNPIEQSLSKITFNAFTSNVIQQYYLNIITPTTSISSVQFDGLPVAASNFFPVASNPALSYAQLDISQGDHSIFSFEGVLVTIYGIGGYESYGYSAGSNFFVPFDFADSVVCPGTPTTFHPIGDTTDIVYYIWDFDDGSPISNTTIPSQTHTFQNYGFYEVELLSLRQGACRADTTKFWVNAMGAGVSIVGPSEICTPQSVTLRAVSLSATSYLWNTGDTTEYITVFTDSTTDYIVHITSPTCDGVDTFRVALIDGTADFDFNTVCFGDTTFFTNLSGVDTPIVSSWNWTFGDGASSQIASPSHVYNTDGSFQATLNITTQLGCQDAITKTVSVNPSPDAQFSYNNRCIHTPPVNFQNQSTINSGFSSYIWDFGDNTPWSADENPAHQYLTADSFDVTLIAFSDFGCNDTITQAINTTQGALVDFTADEVCFGDTTQFINLTDLSGPGVLSYNWSFGDGATSQVADPTTTYSIVGNYTVTLAVEFDDECTLSDTLLVSVNPLPEVDSILVHPICYGDESGMIVLGPTVGTAPFDYLWSPLLANNPVVTNLGAGTYALTVTDSNSCVRNYTYTITQPDSLYYDTLVTHVSCHAEQDGRIQILPFSGTPPYTYNWNTTDTTAAITGLIAGSYSFTLSDANGCNRQLSIDVTQPDSLYVVIVAPSEACIYDATQFNHLIDTTGFGVSNFDWDFDNGDSSQQPALSYIYDSIGDYDIVLTATFTDGCMEADTLTVRVNPLPEVNSTVSPVSCYGENDGYIVLDPIAGISPFDYLWDPIRANSPVITRLDAGVYQLTLTDSNACVNTYSYTITQPDSLYYDTVLTYASCYGFEDGRADLLPGGGTPPYTYTWSDSSASSGIAGLGAGNYSFTLTDAAGCFKQYTIEIGQPDSIYVNISGPDSVLFGDIIDLIANEQVNGIDPQFEWSYLYVDCIDCKETTSMPWGSITYQVTVTDDDGCTAIAEHDIYVDLTKRLFTPNIFTPNGDGLNDMFQIFAFGVREVDFRVFDRWGELIYKTTDINSPWDGTFNGREMPNGVYVYTFQVIYLDSELGKQKGSVTLIR